MHLLESKTNQDEILTEAQAAELLQISHRTLQNWRYQRKGPRFLSITTKNIRYLKKDIAEWLQGKSEKCGMEEGLYEK